ncbi:MAG: NF038104 family lipoprotein [Pseudohongiellaceae bacterium]
MNKVVVNFLTKTTLGLLVVLCLTGCVGAVVGAAVDTTIEVAKVPFKVAGAAVDVIIPDGDDDS